MKKRTARKPAKRNTAAKCTAPKQNPLPTGKKIAIKAIRILKRGGRRLVQVWK